MPQLTRHLMQAALEAEMDVHLEAEAGRTGGLGSRSGGDARNGYRANNAIESLNARYRRSVNACGRFPNDTAALNGSTFDLGRCSALQDSVGKGTNRRPWWSLWLTDPQVK
ncbi:transposase [Streptomyces sp. NPDC002619]|uniref:transposase n=1 Tax=Streptomyces sp. NPDC002619 TaxID=3364655 RepID=UPI0036798D8A